ncbi:MAG: PilC/PilY family type IV pilus protein [Desulfobacterales bacterium]
MKRCLWITMMLLINTAASVWADDTEIYGTVTSVELEPNVLILFDSSGSMSTADVPGDPYDPAITYTGSSPTHAVYYRSWSWATRSYEWILFANDVNDLNCDPIKTSLLTSGNAQGYIRSSDFTCGGWSNRRLRLGNYMNYDESGVGVMKSRIQVAQEVIADLIDTTDGVRFGLFRFNYDEGGRLLAPCGTDKTTLINEINAIDADGYTPLAETLAEVGLYFAGMDSWYNSGVSYTSPMQERCQKNYVIVMTDGEPRRDRSTKLTSESYINGDVIGDYDNDHSGDEYVDTDSSDYLDDVASYLYQNDCNPSLGDGTSFDKQSIATFTIGFKVSHQLLQDTAVNGGGEYFTANNYSDLALAFDQILTSISEKNAVFVAPVVPVSSMNRTYAGNNIYLGFFKPQQSGRWLGNIKRYSLDIYGNLLDATGAEACTADGLIKDNALSFWTTLGADGPDVEKGGAAEVLNLLIEGAANRNLYTYTGTVTALTDPSNLFGTDNIALTNAMLDVAGDAERQNLIQDVHEGPFGDIIHSEPTVLHYPDPDGNPGTDDAKTLIFAGANDGALHCIDDEDGSEVWGFIPPDQLGRLNLLASADHDYFVDGSPVVYDGQSQKILFIGERRGGSYYTALDITTYNAPVWLYSIGPNLLDPDPFNDPDTDVYEVLGQSWSKPEKCTIATNVTMNTNDCFLTVENDVVDVFLLAGGYDNNQDLETPSPTDAVGRAILALNIFTGQPVSAMNFNAITQPTLGMNHSIVDVSGFDHDGDGIVSRIYAGDVGGNIFAFKDDQLQEFMVCSQPVYQRVADGVWETHRRLFNASADGVQRKILYAPDAVEEIFGEYIYFGTGDRADPSETDVVNRFYAIKNDWADTTVDLTESDLVDVTDDIIQLGTTEQKEAVFDELEAGKGWYIRLENPGEKVVASPRVYAGIVYFTTYTPADPAVGDPEDPCAVSNVRGEARLYAVDYKTGGSVYDFNPTVELGGEGEEVPYGKLDRIKTIGTAIPSAPVIAILESDENGLGGGARLFAGVEGGIVSLETKETPDMYRYYWHQLF